MSYHDPIKVIFLDFDGVLNSDEYRTFRPPLAQDTRFDTPEREDYDLDRAAIRRMNRVIEVTKAKVVVSSMWRLVRSRADLRGILARNGLIGEVIDKTPHLSGQMRGIEIRTWLYSTILNIESWVIYDDDKHDDEFVAFGLDRLVRTPHELGMLDEHIDIGIGILNTPWRRQ